MYLRSLIVSVTLFLLHSKWTSLTLRNSYSEEKAIRLHVVLLEEPKKKGALHQEYSNILFCLFDISFSLNKCKSSSRLNTPKSDIAFHPGAWELIRTWAPELGFSPHVLKCSAEAAGAFFLRQIHWQQNTGWKLRWVAPRLWHNRADPALPECPLCKILQATWKFKIHPEIGKLKIKLYYM